MVYSYPDHKSIDCHIRMTFIQTLRHKFKKKTDQNTFNTFESCEFAAFRPQFGRNKKNSAGSQKCDDFYTSENKIPTNQVTVIIQHL